MVLSQQLAVRGTEATSGHPTTDLEENLHSGGQVRRVRAYFPCRFPCIPALCGTFVPTQFHHFHGWLHVLLFIGVASSLCLAIDAILNVYESFTGNSRVRAWEIRHVIDLCFIFPTLCYFCRTIGQYDDDLFRRREDIEAARQELTGAYKEEVNSMKSLLEGLATAGINICEQTFEENRNNFIQFLVDFQKKYGSSRVGPKIDLKMERELPKQMKCLILNWLDSFKECSIDPVSNPNKVVNEDQMENLELDDLCKLCIERLKENTCDIAIKQSEDKALVGKIENKLQQINSKGDKISTGLAQSTIPWWSRAASSAGDGFHRGVHYARAVSWVAFGFGTRIHVQAGLEKDFLCMIPFGCGCMVILSREHLMLILSFCAGWVMLYLETKILMKVLLCVFLLTITLTLIRFQDIDIIQRLAQEERNIQKETEEVQNRRQNMERHWASVKKQVDLWQHRTVPGLLLFRAFLDKLLRMDEDIVLDFMSNGNCALEQLNDSLGPLEKWFSDGEIPSTQKEQYQDAVRQTWRVISEAKLDEKSAEIADQVIDSLNLLNDHAFVKGLKALPSPSPSVVPVQSAVKAFPSRGTHI